jgi:protein TonB
MKHTVQLFEFMPYGAPELLESRQRHLGRALLLTCGSFLLLVAIIGGVTPLLGTPRSVPVIASVDVLPPIDRPRIEPPPLLPPSAPRVRHSAPDIAVPVPTPDAPSAPVETPAPEPTGATTGPVGPSGPADIGVASPVEGAWPSPDAPVYVEQLPTVVKAVKPIYPSLAMEAGIEGLVMVKVLVGKDGHVLDVLLSDKIQVPMLNEAALAAARQWVFTPGIDNGRPVACWTAIPFRFRLH